MSSVFYLRPIVGQREPNSIDYECASIDQSGYVSPVIEHLEAGALPTKLRDADVILILDAAKVRSTLATIPGRSQQQAATAAPYTIEDDVADDIENLEVVVGAQMDDGQRALCFGASEYFDGVVLPLSKNGITVKRAHSEALFLPYKQHGLSLLVDDDRVLMRFGETLGTAVERDNTAILLPRIIKQCRPVSVEVFIARGSVLSEEETRIFEEFCGDIPLAKKELSVDTLPWLLGHVENNHGLLNCLPKRLAVQPLDSPVTRRLKIAAAIAATAILSHIGLEWFGIQRTESAVAVVQEAQATVFRQAFPEVKRIVNPEAQSKQLVATLAAQGSPPADFLEILHQSTDLFDGMNREIGLTGMTFADGVLLLRTETPDMDRLESYRADLADSLSAEVVTAESAGNTVRGAIRIRKIAQ